MAIVLGDVVVRARGLATHLLDRAALQQLARSSGPGVLSGALQDVGYWPAPSSGGPAPSAARVVDRAIEHEAIRRLAVLARWLGDRFGIFSAVFERETRELLRIRVRELATGAAGSGALAPAIDAGWPALRDLAAVLSRAADWPALTRGLTRIGSRYAAPLAEALRAPGDRLRALESALDRTWAHAARRSAHRGGDALLAWVETEIDLRNAWDALAGGGGEHLEGGRALDEATHASIARDPDETTRRRTLARALHDGPLRGVFDDPAIDLASLEARARAARIQAARRASRLDPIGASPVVEVVLRLEAERADLRCISWGVAQGLAYEAVAGRLVGAA